MRTTMRARGSVSLVDSLIEGSTSLLRAGSTSEPVSLVYYPIAESNPFQSLLYSRSFENGFCCVGTNDIEELLEINWPWPIFLHVHWLGNAIGNAESEFVAGSRLRSYIRAIESFKDNGGGLLWTVHNTLPHDAILTRQQIELRNRLSELCDGYHIMNRETPKIVKPFFKINPKKCFYTPHPSYSNHYPDTISPTEARFQLGIDSDEFVFLFFGSIQHYKGLDLLLSAYQSAVGQTERRCRLVVAGRPSNPSEFNKLLDAMSHDPSILVFDQSIKTEDVQVFFHSANVCVCPYRKTLNSGVTLLSHTFGTPVIGPDIAAFSELLDGGAGILYEANNLDSLVKSLLFAIEQDLNKPKQIIADDLPNFSPHQISNQFFEHILALSGGGEN